MGARAIGKSRRQSGRADPPAICSSSQLPVPAPPSHQGLLPPRSSTPPASTSLDHGLPRSHPVVPAAIPPSPLLPIAAEPRNTCNSNPTCPTTATPRAAAAPELATPPASPPVLCQSRSRRARDRPAQQREQLAAAHRSLPAGYVGGVPEVPHGHSHGPPRPEGKAATGQDADAGFHRGLVFWHGTKGAREWDGVGP